MTGRLKVPEEVWKSRLQRMVRLIELNAPKEIIAAEASILASSYEISPEGLSTDAPTTSL